MKTIERKYTLIKSFDDLFTLSDTSHQITLQSILNGRIYTKENGWIDVKLSFDLKKELCKMAAETFGGRENTKKHVYINLLNDSRQHWGLSRTIIERDKENNPYLYYIAGQDMVYEIAQIRNDLK